MAMRRLSVSMVKEQNKYQKEVKTQKQNTQAKQWDT